MRAGLVQLYVDLNLNNKNMKNIQANKGMGAISIIILLVILIAGGTVVYKMYNSSESNVQTEETVHKQIDAKEEAKEGIISVKAILESDVDKTVALDKLSDIKVDLFNAYEDASDEAKIEMDNLVASITELEEAIKSESDDVAIFIDGIIAEIDTSIESHEMMENNESMTDDQDSMMESEEEVMKDDDSVMEESGEDASTETDVDASVETTVQ